MFSRPPGGALAGQACYPHREQSIIIYYLLPAGGKRGVSFYEKNTPLLTHPRKGGYERFALHAAAASGGQPRRCLRSAATSRDGQQVAPPPKLRERFSGAVVICPVARSAVSERMVSMFLRRCAYFLWECQERAFLFKRKALFCPAREAQNN